MNTVLRQAVFAPESLDQVVADDPSLGLVRVYPAGVTAARRRIDVGPPGVGQFDVRASDQAVVGVVPGSARIDLDRLFSRVYDVDVVDDGALCVASIGGHHVDGVIIGLSQRQIGDGHV